MCFEIYQPDPALFLSAPGLAWEVALKKTKVRLDLFTDIDMLLMVEKGFRGRICRAIYWHAKANIKLDILTNIGVFVIVEKVARAVICHSIYRYVKANNKYIKIYDKNKKS